MLKINKGMSVLLASMIAGNMLVGCSSNKFDSTEYLSDSGKQALEVLKNEDREYKKIESLTILGEVEYKDQYVSITGKVDNIKFEDNLMVMWLDSDCNESPYPIRVYIPKNMVDVKFNEGDTITAKGRFNKLAQHKDDKDLKYWHINAYFLELDDTTNKDTTSKEAADNKEVAAEKPSSSKPEEKTVSNEKKQTEPTNSTPKEDNNKSTQKNTNQKKTTDSKPKKEDNDKSYEEPEQKGYWVTCPNGHQVYTENGDWNCNQCEDEWQEQQETEEAEDLHGELDDETGLAKVKEGTHLEEEAEQQDNECYE